MSNSLFLLCMVLSILSFFIGTLSQSRPQNNLGHNYPVLNVGNELKKQVLHLNMGQEIYIIHGIKESCWYEVKISYPASIPASFSIQVKNDASYIWLTKNRRLLDTEKIIFKSDNNTSKSGQKEMYALVTVKSKGIVAKPRVQESEFVLFNIVCDELSFGIPHKTLWVGTAAILCLILASLAPFIFTLERWLKIQALESSYSTYEKAS